MRKQSLILLPLKKNISYCIIYFVFWIILFQLCRLVFIAVNIQFLTSGGLFIAKAMSHGLLMDAAIAAYISIPAMLLMVLYVYLKTYSFKSLLKLYTATIIVLSLLIITIDLFTYKTWRFRLDDSPLKYLLHPKEAIAAASNLPIFFVVIFYLVSIATICFAINKLFFARLQQSQQINLSIKTKIWQSFVMLLFIAAFIIPARGGLQQIPINQSSVYFTDKIFYNHAATNVCWVFVNSLVKNDQVKTNPYAKVNQHDALLIKGELFLSDNDTNFQKILKNGSSRPNIIFIIWESFAKKATERMLGGVEVTSHFNQYKKEGIYFSNIFATGDRTDKGIVAVLSGYPAQPITSIIQSPNKVRTLPVISKTLFNQGYNTAFYYGGELEFANLKAYIIGSGFNNITTVKNFEGNDLNSKWGAHDHVVAKKIIDDLQSQQSPFFFTWLTLSSHEPYEVPYASITNKHDDESLFLNSHHYMDSVLFTFIEGCKKLPSWQNTLVVITADHGHPLPSTGNKIDDFKMPLLLLGGALSKTNLYIKTTGSQIDIPATILAQLEIPANEFIWSKNLFSSSVPNWAYFSFNNGYGFVQPNDYYIFDNVGGKTIEMKGNPSATQINKGKILQQLTFQDYIER